MKPHQLAAMTRCHFDATKLVWHPDRDLGTCPTCQRTFSGAFLHACINVVKRENAAR